MKFRKQMYTKGILKEVNKCKPDELKELLKRIETEIEKSEVKNDDYLMAKTIITSRLASKRSKNVE